MSDLKAAIVVLACILIIALIVRSGVRRLEKEERAYEAMSEEEKAEYDEHRRIPGDW